MMLDVNNQFIDILCIIVIAFCLILCLMIINTKTKLTFSLKILSILAIILLTIIASMLFINDTYDVDNQKNYCEVKDTNKNNPDIIPIITYNKVIIVGDSRMEFIVDDKGKYNIPLNYTFVAKSGSAIKWFKEIAVSRVTKMLDNMNKNYTYHVVINMGVNDLYLGLNVKQRANEYFNTYKKLAKTYPNVYFYILSVNPVQNRVVYNDTTAKQKNILIDKFNDTIVNLTKEEKLDNMTTCDSNNNIHFMAYDGLHYDVNTNKQILKYISNKCVQYK